MILEGKVAIVTGGSRGLGKAMSIELAREGASVAVVARTVDPGKSRLPGTIYETADEIKQIGGKAFAVRCDITDEKNVGEMINQVNQHYGQVDILINNAGVATLEPFIELSTRKWDLVTAVNLRGTFLCSKAVLPQMVERKSGNIINLSSILAKTIEKNIAYGATKAAIERFTLGLAKEMREYNVAVNALRPDFTATEAVLMFEKDVDAAELQQPEMWGKYAVLVAAQSADALTGEILDEAALRKRFGELKF